jgi:WXXGXW repeat (2 copies)
MQKNLAKLLFPAVLVVFSCAPAFAQVRVGVDLGAIRIRIAPDAPPPLRVENRPPRPSRNHIWIGGSWDRQNDQWAWAPGRWEEPAQRGSSWVKPQYRKDSGAYRYEPGHWSHQKLEEGDDYTRWHKEHGK